MFSVIELRRERRIPCVVTPVVVFPGGEPSFDAAILDVSKSGIKLRAGRALEPGQEVQVTVTDAKTTMVLRAECHYCVPSEDDGWEMGLEIRDSVTGPGAA